MASPLEIILTIVVMSFWFLFPIGIFLSVSHVDKSTDQVVRLGALRHGAEEGSKHSSRVPIRFPKRPGWRKPHAVSLHFRRWISH